MADEAVPLAKFHLGLGLGLGLGLDEAVPLAKFHPLSFFISEYARGQVTLFFVILDGLLDLE